MLGIDANDNTVSQHGVAKFVASMLFWLWGRPPSEYRLIGGQAWPWSCQEQIGRSYGYPDDRADQVVYSYGPDWDDGSDKAYLHYAARL